MGINYLDPYLGAFFVTAEYHYKKIRMCNEEEHIHQLRVSLKQINALFRLLAFVAPDSFQAKSAFLPLKELFDFSGTVRDLQIAQSVLQRYEINGLSRSAHMHESLREEMDMAQAGLLEWKKKHRGVQLLKLAYGSAKDLKPISKARWLEGSSAHMEDMLAKITVLQASRKRDKWHRIRIVLRRIRCVMDWALTLKKDFISSDQYKKMRLLGELLGDWHDRVMVTASIRAQSKWKIPSIDRKNDQDFMKKLSSDQQGLLAASRFYLRDLIAEIGSNNLLPAPPKVG